LGCAGVHSVIIRKAIFERVYIMVLRVILKATATVRIHDSNLRVNILRIRVSSDDTFRTLEYKPQLLL
jgi:hypothetical protein